MRNALKKELAILTTVGALTSLKLKSPFWTTLFAASAAGLMYSSSKKNFNYQGKKVYITGGSRGLGLSMAWNLLKLGAEVTLCARDKEELNRGRNILLKDFPQASVHISVVDITKTEELAQSLDQAILQMGGIDLLVNNAGSILVGPFSSMEKEDFEAQVNLHLYAVVQAIGLIFPHFKSKGEGRILNICSLGGKIAVPHMLPYDASKFALAGFSQGVTAELAPHNILVTTAFPTVMRTGSPIQAVFKGDHGKEFQWFETIDNLPLLSMSADTAAKKVLQAVIDGQSEIILSGPAKLRLFFGNFFPETMNALMGLVAAVLPTKDSAFRKTGADSDNRFYQNPYLKPIQIRAQKVQDQYNQIPHHNAEFNMGLSDKTLNNPLSDGLNGPFDESVQEQSPPDLKH